MTNMKKKEYIKPATEIEEGEMFCQSINNGSADDSVQRSKDRTGTHGHEEEDLW